MMIGLRRRIYQDLLSPTLGLAMYGITNHMCVISYNDFCTHVCTLFYAKLIKEGQCAFSGLRAQQLYIDRSYLQTPSQI